MEPPRLGDRARSKLIHLLSDDHPEPQRWVGRLRSLGEVENTPVFSNAVRFLFHLDFGDKHAEQLIENVLEHRRFLTRLLGRDPGLRVAAMDYLSNVEKRYANPKIVEMQDYEETERSARTDALTGLANRRVFRDTLEREIRRSRRYHWPLSLVLLDLDHFKVVNDSHGHMLGDLILQRVGSILRHAVREADVACRFGGEEFVVVLPETARLGGYAVAERIRRRVEAAFLDRPVGGHEVTMTVSGGLATFPEDGLHAAAIVARADEALYGAKRAGRNRVGAHYREKRAAFRFPPKATTVARLGDDPSVGAHPVNLSRTGVLVETEAAVRVADSVAVVLGRNGPSGPEDPWRVTGRVVRIAADESRPGQRHMGIAFEAPMPEDRLMARVSLSRPGGRTLRGGPR